MRDKTSALVTPEHRDTRRRFEQWARNPGCEANTLSAVHGISMPAVARAENARVTMGQSPFAIQRGQTFERVLFREEAKSLREALAEAAVLPADAVATFADFRLKQHGGALRNLDAARDGTTAWLRDVARARAKLLAVVAAGPAILIPSGVMLPEAMLVVDVLVARRRKDGIVELVVGEVKTFPDRGGHTDPGELAAARAQAGVYVHGLRLVVRELGLEDRLTITDHGFLVFSRPGFNRPSVRAGEDFRFQAWRAERGFAQLERAAARLPAVTGDPDTPSRIDTVRCASTSYEPTCVSFCDRASVCYGRALSAQDPVVLGDDAARMLHGVSLDRAAALLGGARARTTAEENLVAIIGAAE